MALAIDGSSPAIATQTSNTTATVTTASFTPPDNSVLLILWSWNSNTLDTPTTPTITDNLGVHLTYNLIDFASRSDSPACAGQAASWWAQVGSSAAMTITTTSNSGLQGGALCVLVLTGAHASPIGAHGKLASTSASSIAQNYTAQATNGWGFIATCDWDVVGLQTAGTGCTLIGSGSPGSQVTYGFLRRTSADDSNGATNTLNVTLPASSANLHWVYVEVLPAAGGSSADPSPQWVPGFASGTSFPAFLDATTQPWPRQLPYDLGAVGDVAASAENTTAAGTAFDASIAITASADQTAATGVANDASVAAGALAENAAAAGTANTANIDVTVNADVTSATGTANDASIAIQVFAETTSATGAAFDATVSTAAQTNANAELASGTGTANDAANAITVNAEGTAATGAAFDATITITVPAGVSTGSGATLDAQGGVGAQADIGSATGAANLASLAIQANAEATAALGAALDITAAGTQVHATSTPTVTADRASTPAVAANRTSTDTTAANRTSTPAVNAGATSTDAVTANRTSTPGVT